MKARRSALISAAKEINSEKQRVVNSCLDTHEGQRLCSVSVLLVYILCVAVWLFLVFKDTRTFGCDKTDHNVNKTAAEGGIVKIAFVIARRLWALV